MLLVVLQNQCNCRTLCISFMAKWINTFFFIYRRLNSSRDWTRVEFLENIRSQENAHVIVSKRNSNTRTVALKWDKQTHLLNDGWIIWKSLKTFFFYLSKRQHVFSRLLLTFVKCLFYWFENSWCRVSFLTFYAFRLLSSLR